MAAARLDGKVAIVTGAARGIGEAIARVFVEHNAFVYVTDIDDELGDGVARRLGAKARYLHLDVRDESDWQRVTSQAVREMSKVDVVVNNAGITGFEEGPVPHDPEHATLENWRQVHRTDLDGVFLGCKYAIRCMGPREPGRSSTSRPGPG